jgi:hypothetical protein
MYTNKNTHTHTNARVDLHQDPQDIALGCLASLVERRRELLAVDTLDHVEALYAVDQHLGLVALEPPNKVPVDVVFHKFSKVSALVYLLCKVTV